MNNKRTLKDYFRVVWKNIYLVLILVVLSSGALMIYSEKRPIYYESKSVILIKDDNEIYNEQKLKTFALYFNTRDLVEDIIEELEISDSYKKISDSITTKVVKNTNYIEIKVRHSNNETTKKITDNLILKFDEKFSSIYPEVEVVLIEEARATDGYVRINFELYLQITMVLSFITGVILVILFGTDNVSIKNHEDLDKYLGLKSLGIIPNNDIDNVTNNSKKKKKKNLIEEINIKILKDSGSLISESYRMVRTNLDFLDLKVINFTSTTAGEGKSESISNIATSFAMIGKKTLLIDCDLRKPTIHRRFNVNRTLGLTDILIYDRIETYHENVQRILLPDSKNTIDLLTAGSKVSNPSELLSSPRFNKLLKKLREDYDLVLIDCPPVSLMTDAVIISSLTDGTAYIVEYDRINYSAIKNCINQLKDVNVNVLGGVITKININKQKKLYGNKYEYYYSNYM